MNDSREAFGGQGGGVAVLQADAAIPPSAGYLAGASAEGAAGPDGEAGVARNTPPPNRGCFRPKWGELDYLRLTIYGNVSQVQEIVENTLIDKYLAQEFSGWLDLGPRARISATFQACGCIQILVPSTEEPWVGLELRGQALQRVDNEGVRYLLQSLPMAWHSTRADLCWDGVPFTVADVRSASLAGCLRSRCFKGGPEGTDFRGNGDGETAYVGGTKQGENGRVVDYGKPKLLRVYDKRGADLVRCELQLRDAPGRAIGADLLSTPADKWPQLFMGILRETVDFVDTSDGQRATRAALLPWWSAFVQSAERKRLQLPQREGGSFTAIGKLEQLFKRYGHQLLAARDVLSEEWFWKRVEFWAKQRPSEQREAFQLELRNNRAYWAAHHVAGVTVPAEPEVPF